MLVDLGLQGRLLRDQGPSPLRSEPEFSRGFRKLLLWRELRLRCLRCLLDLFRGRLKAHVAQVAQVFEGASGFWTPSFSKRPCCTGSAVSHNSLTACWYSSLAASARAFAFPFPLPFLGPPPRPGAGGEVLQRGEPLGGVSGKVVAALPGAKRRRRAAERTKCVFFGKPFENTLETFQTF